MEFYTSLTFSLKREKRWLTKGKKSKRDAFYEFIGENLTKEVLDDLHYQFICHLEKEGLITLKEHRKLDISISEMKNLMKLNH